MLARFTWARAAEGTVARYREVIDRARPRADRPLPAVGADRPVAAAAGVFAAPSESSSESRATC